MRRRELLTLLCGGGAGISGLQIEASAQTPTTARRVAFVVSTGRRGRRQGWKQIGRRPDASDREGRKLDRRQVRNGDPTADKSGGSRPVRTPNVPERSGRGEQG